MSKRLRNKPPSPERIAKAKEAYKVAKYLVGQHEVDTLIENIIEKHPKIFLDAMKALMLKEISWKGLMIWIDENANELEDNPNTRHLRPTKINFIKMHRILTNSSLRDAKEEVEKFMEEKGWSSDKWNYLIE